MISGYTGAEEIKRATDSIRFLESPKESRRTLIAVFRSESDVSVTAWIHRCIFGLKLLQSSFAFAIIIPFIRDVIHFQRKKWNEIPLLSITWFRTKARFVSC